MPSHGPDNGNGMHPGIEGANSRVDVWHDYKRLEDGTQECQERIRWHDDHIYCWSCFWDASCLLFRPFGGMGRLRDERK